MRLNSVLTTAAAVVSIAPTALAEGSTVGVLMEPEASCASHSALTTMSKANTTFDAYSGTTNVTYEIRTTTAGRTGEPRHSTRDERNCR
jgi:hypothetical protein